MKIRDPRARSMLSAEYVVGTLQGRARSRFELWLRSDPGLRREVEHWQQRLEPMGSSYPEEQPSPAVWQRIQSRIDPARDTRRASSWLSSLAFWRVSSLATAALAAVMFGYIALGPARPGNAPADAMVVVLQDQTETPMMTVAWAPDVRGTPRLRLRVIGHQTMDPETAWELWMIPGPGEAPRSLGLITTHETQFVPIPSGMLPALNAAAGMAMSVEPKGGSPTGRPTGPVLYSGHCVKI